MTESGKTTLARKIAKQYRAKGIPVLVLDPYLSKKWEADFITDDPVKFLAVVKNSRSCAVFVDECGHWVEEGHEPILKWLATNARHYGHNVHFITQRATQVSPTVRDQCRNVFLFVQSFEDCKLVARDKAAPEFLKGAELVEGEYLGKIGLSGKVYKAKVF